MSHLFQCSSRMTEEGARGFFRGVWMRMIQQWKYEPLAVKGYVAGEMRKETEKVILKKKLRQNKRYAAENCMFRHLLEIMYAGKSFKTRRQQRAEEQIAKRMKSSERHLRTLHSKMVWGRSISGKKNSLSYKSLELKCFLHPVDSEEAGRFAVEKWCCAEVYGEEIRTSHGMNSKWISTFCHRNR